MENVNLMEMAANIGLYFVPFLFALCFHEYAHGWMAKRKGDSTAEDMGRLNLNPVSHADPIGTLLLPLAAIVSGLPFFGWAKPVPVNPRNLKDPRNDMFWIALAGPLANFLLVVVGGVGLLALQLWGHYLSSQGVLLKMLNMFMIINLFLGVFNLIPVHPLDGGKVLARFLPDSWNERLETHQHALSMGLIVVFVMGGFRYLAGPVLWFHETVTGLILGTAHFLAA